MCLQFGEERDISLVSNLTVIYGDWGLRRNAFHGGSSVLKGRQFGTKTLALPTFCTCILSRVRLFATPLTLAYQASLSMGFSRQEYWSGLRFPSPGDLPDPGIEPGSPALEADALTSEPPGMQLRV